MTDNKDIIGIVKEWKKSAAPWVELEGMKVGSHTFGAGGIIVNPREAYDVAQALTIAVEALEYCRAVPMWKTQDSLEKRLRVVYEVSENALSQIKAL